MTRREDGFTLLELAIVISLSAMIALTATTFAFHALRSTARTEDHVTAVANADNAARWASHDAYMADRVIADNLTSPTLVIFKWTDWGYNTSNVYYSATYSIEDVTGGIGQLNRRLQSSAGVDQQMVVAKYVYFNAADPANSTNVTCQDSTVSLRVATRFGSTGEVRECEIYRRPNF